MFESSGGCPIHSPTKVMRHGYARDERDGGVAIFDGVAVAVARGREEVSWRDVRTNPNARAAHRIRLDDAATFPIADAYGFPRIWPVHGHQRARHIALAVPLAPGSHPGAPVTPAISIAGYAKRALVGSWEIDATEWIAPAAARGLHAVRPAPGHRLHLGLDGAASICGRISVDAMASRSATRDERFRIDCGRCRSTSHVAGLQDEQLARFGALSERVGLLEAATMAQIWPRMSVREPKSFPLVLDGMVGAVIYQMPGSPDPMHVLEVLRRHTGVVSAESRSWMIEMVRPRVVAAVRQLRANGSTVSDAVDAKGLRLLRYLPAPDAADTLVSALLDHGPVPALEPMALRLAEEAGGQATDQIIRWRRIHRIAAALGGGR